MKKNIKTVRIAFLSLLAWITGLAFVLTAIDLGYENPSIQDVAGFGSILLAGCLVAIPLYILAIVA